MKTMFQFVKIVKFKKMITNETDETVKGKLGFLPTSVWKIVKTKCLLSFVDDKEGQGSYSRNGEEQTNRLSQFNPDVAKRILKIWSEKGDLVLDPFAGRCRALIAMQMERNYVGFEISPKAYAQLTERLNRATLNEFINKPVLYNQDSRGINFVDKFDLVFSCPPYWDVEDYNKCYEENVSGQLSDLHNYDSFLVPYKEIIKKCYTALKPGKYCVWVVNDIRRNKTLIPFGADTIKIFQSVGFKFHDIIINQLFGLAVMGVGMAIENKYVPKMHEYILVFKKQ